MKNLYLLLAGLFLDNQLKRMEWIESMHRTAPGTNWRAMEYQTQQRRASVRAQQANSRGLEEVLANGAVVGTWLERGSLNQAGSVRDLEYDVETDEIWVISDGGTLWKGPRSGNAWEVINQDVQLTPGFLKFIPTATGRRLLAMIAKVPHYSDDDGLTWQSSTGIAMPADFWSRSKHAIVLDDADHTIYICSNENYNADIKLYKSTDQGATFVEIYDFNTNNHDDIALSKMHHSNEILMVRRGFPATLWRVNLDTDEVEIISDNDQLNLAGGRANIAGHTDADGVTTLYVFDGDNGKTFRSVDYGVTWSINAQIQENPWEVGLYVLPSNPDILLAGGLECHRSPNGGTSWVKANDWWTYYQDINTQLHADMMYFAEFETAAGDPFLLVSNHGGLSVSYDDGASFDNIALITLNVGQYYTVRHSEQYPDWLFVGTQDQGWQRGNGANADQPLLEQPISGDYGHLTFTKGGQSLWMAYPGGAISMYENPTSGDITGGFTVDSNDETVWLAPLMASPDDSEDAVYMAGGNINGGNGSHLIKLTKNDEVDASQQPFNFKANSAGGVLSSIAYSSLNTNKFFGATTNGRFFYSDNQGVSWEQTVNFLPEGHYLYGQAIYPSKLDENKVWLAGSGYDNPAVYVSNDGGNNFEAFAQGLPNTMVYELTGNADETMLFAATEAGPYVYVFEAGEWFDMSGVCAPAQTYWTVDFVEATQTARFGTYGRGIWDFNFKVETNINEQATAAISLKAYPNPVVDALTVNFENIESASVKLYNLKGQLLSERSNFLKGQALDMSTLVKGNYLLQVQSEKGNATKIIVKQ